VEEIVLLVQIYGVSSAIDGEHLEEFVGNIGQCLMLKSRTTYLLPPKSRLLRAVAHAIKWL
jgi:hypothetical protein